MENEQKLEKTYQNMWIAGIDDRRYDITISSGRFTSIKEAKGSFSGQNFTTGDLWISPGLIDMHTHLAWTDFDHQDQERRDAHEIEVMQARAFTATLKTGVTTVRDAGGLLPVTAEFLSRHYEQPLKVIACAGMLGSEDAKGSDYLEQRVMEISKTGGAWIKIFAAGGLGASSDRVLEPLFSKQEFFSIVNSAHSCNKKVMVHTWGGTTLDWAMEARADSVEHGVYLTKRQAEDLAYLRIPYIPTTAIYRIAAEADGVLGLSRKLRDRAARAGQAHQEAVRNAKEAGVQIVFGTDFATPALHGNNLEELYTLMDCGLTREEAWKAATETAAEVLGYGHTLGQVKEGFTADAVIYRQNPYHAKNAKELKENIVSVITGTLQ